MATSPAVGRCFPVRRQSLTATMPGSTSSSPSKNRPNPARSRGWASVRPDARSSSCLAACSGGVPEDAFGIAQVGLEIVGLHRHPGLHDRVVVDVEDQRRRIDPPRDLMRVVGHRQARADIEELPYPRGSQEMHASPKEIAVFAGRQPRGRERPRDQVTRLAIGREMVGAAEPVVVAPSRVRALHAHIKQRARYRSSGDRRPEAVAMGTRTGERRWPGAEAPGRLLMAVQTVSRIGGSRAASEAGSGGRTLRIERYAMGAPTATRIAATISENW